MFDKRRKTLERQINDFQSDLDISLTEAAEEQKDALSMFTETVKRLKDTNKRIAEKKSKLDEFVASLNKTGQELADNETANANIISKIEKLLEV